MDTERGCDCGVPGAVGLPRVRELIDATSQITRAGIGKPEKFGISGRSVDSRIRMMLWICGGGGGGTVGEQHRTFIKVSGIKVSYIGKWAKWQRESGHPPHIGRADFVRTCIFLKFLKQ